MAEKTYVTVKQALGNRYWLAIAIDESDMSATC